MWSFIKMKDNFVLFTWKLKSFVYWYNTDRRKIIDCIYKLYMVLRNHDRICKGIYPGFCCLEFAGM